MAKKILSGMIALYLIFAGMFIFFPNAFTRLAIDDFSITIKLLKTSFLQSQIFWWTQWSGRFTTHMVITAFGYLAAFHHGNTGPYGIILVGFLFLSFYFLISALFKSNSSVRFILAAMSFVSLFFFSPNIAETWFWFSGETSYLLPLALMMSSLAIGLSEKKHWGWDVLAASLAFFATSGSESFGILSLFLQFSFLLFLKLTGRFKNHQSRLSLIFIFSIFSYSVLFFAPGNKVRRKAIALEPLGIIDTLVLATQLGAKLFFEMFRRRIFDVLVYFVSCVYIFLNFLPTIKLEAVSKKPKYMNSVWLLIMLFLSAIVYCLPGANASHQAPPDRSHSTFALCMVGALLAISYGCAEAIKMNSNIFSGGALKKSIAVRFGLLVILVSAINLVSEGSRYFEKLKLTPKYAKVYDYDYEIMIKYVASSEQPPLEELPPSGMVFSSYGMLDCDAKKNCHYNKEFYSYLK